ncbi:hypothetical protein [Prescottella equi]|uniref:hypothetical protein n=1 Tax=Rhodococcus hoagii TaxID=43767 RepID=UPI000A117433|nr:hypothetical protein [Prescottella equi]ORL79071.1 hypothetical protein A5905_14225 [Prescottella equi]
MLRWLDREPVQRWLGTLFLAWVVILVGPSAIDRATSEPSAWDWVWLCIFGFALAGSAVGVVSAWRNRNTPAVEVARVTPAEIPDVDVRTATEGIVARISAIKRLRQMFPGLGLRDTKDCVDRQLLESGSQA